MFATLAIKPDFDIKKAEQEIRQSHQSGQIAGVMVLKTARVVIVSYYDGMDFSQIQRELYSIPAVLEKSVVLGHGAPVRSQPE